MTELIKNLEAEKAKNDAKIASLQSEVAKLKEANKAIDKALKALTPPKS